jgi:hypothetical protein
VIGRRRFLVALAAAPVAAGCGYHAVYGEGEGERFHVRLVSAVVADAAAADEVASGARETLAREGALLPGDGHPALCIEVVRLDERSTGVSGASGTPQARGSARAVVARAWLERTAGAPEERATGDVRAEVELATGPSPAADALAQDDALRAAARRLGQRLALRILGHPTGSD